MNVDSRGATLTVEDDLGTVEADRLRLAAVFENLFRNAVEHGVSDEPSLADAREDALEHGSTSPDSQAHEDAVETGVSDEPSLADAPEHGGEEVTVRVGAFEDGFYVEDDGPGVPLEEREQVFDHGYTTGDDGTGFGLNIVQNVVEAHEWEIRLTEGADGGARFEAVTRPESAAPVAAAVGPEH